MKPDMLFSLFHASHAIDPHRVRALGREDRDRLRRMALGEVPAPDRGRALEAWAELALPDVAVVFDRVLGDNVAPIEARAAAARHLGRLGMPDAEALLARRLAAESHPVVQIKILAALARVGTLQTIDDIRRLAASKEPAVARQARFAIRVIAHRHGVNAGLDPEPARPIGPVPGMRPFSVTGASAETVAAVLASLREETFGVIATHASSFEMTCGGRQLVLLLDDRYRIDQAEPAKRPTLIGIITGRAAADGSYSVSRVVLGHPQTDQGGIAVEIYRTDGVFTQAGQARRADDHVDVEIGAVDGPGNAALDIRLELRQGQIRILKATSALRVIERLVPAPFTPPNPDT